MAIKLFRTNLVSDVHSIFPNLIVPEVPHSLRYYNANGQQLIANS